MVVDNKNIKKRNRQIKQCIVLSEQSSKPLTSKSD